MVNMKELTLNKRCGKLRNWYFKIKTPTAVVFRQRHEHMRDLWLICNNEQNLQICKPRKHLFFKFAIVQLQLQGITYKSQKLVSLKDENKNSIYKSANTTIN